MSDRDIDGLVKRLDDEIAAVMGPVGNPAEEPVVLYMDAAAAIRELQADIKKSSFHFDALMKQSMAERIGAEAAEAERDRLRGLVGRYG